MTKIRTKSDMEINCDFENSLSIHIGDFIGEKILVEEVLKATSYQKTKKIFISDINGSRCGPYIFKNFDGKSGLGEIYEKLLNHKCKNIPKVYYAKDHDVIEQYVEGELLSNLIKNNQISFNDIFSYCNQLCKAIKFLHSNFKSPIIHRDIKPSNIIVSDNVVYLIDFGIARKYDPMLKDKPDTIKFGTVGFAPPEQFGYQQTDVRSDIYSLGKVLQHLITSLNVSQLTRIEKLKVELLKNVSNKATNFNPKDRYTSISQFQNSLCNISANKNPLLSSNVFENNNNKFFRAAYKIGSTWNYALFVCLLILEVFSFYSIFFDTGETFGDKSVIYKTLAAICIMILLYLPIFYTLLFKPHVRDLKCKFPKLLGKIPVLSFPKCIILILICFFWGFILLCLAAFVQ